MSSKDWGLEAIFSSTLNALLAPSFSLPDPDPHLPSSPLAIALSGGADSMALTLLAHDWAQARGVRIIALTVDHGLRSESRAEAETVARWMHARGIEHHILTPPMQPAIRNSQAQARARRYEALVEACTALGCTHILLAHHADDQAETVALQRHRGSTPPSRAGMPAVRQQGNLALMRPLLGIRKQKLVDYLQAQSQSWAEDPSNISDRYARNRLRKQLSEPEIIALWHEAQRAGEMRHTAETVRNEWMQRFASTTHTTATLDRSAWLVLTALDRMDYLSHAIRIIGGKRFRPRLMESERLVSRLVDAPHGVATLGHCRIAWKMADIVIAPEHSTRSTLDSDALPPHMMGEIPHENMLVSKPFWWFSFPLQTS